MVRGSVYRDFGFNKCIVTALLSVCVCVCVCVCMYVCMYRYVCVCVLVYMYLNVFFSAILQLVNQGTVAYAGGGLMRDVKNKAVLCKPLTLTKATYCKPHMQSKHLQTGEDSILLRVLVIDKKKSFYFLF